MENSRYFAKRASNSNVQVERFKTETNLRSKAEATKSLQISKHNTPNEIKPSHYSAKKLYGQQEHNSYKTLQN